MSTLEILENDEQTYKPRHKNKSKTPSITNEKKKQKNLYRHHRHPNAKHKWKDCIYNPKSKYFCGHTGREDMKPQEENHQTIQKNSTKRTSRNKCQSHQDSSSSLDSSNINLSTSSIESNYPMAGENTYPTKTILSTEVLLGTRADNKNF